MRRGPLLAVPCPPRTCARPGAAGASAAASNDCPGREITTKCARPRTSGYSCHVAISANASVPVMKNKCEAGRPPACSARKRHRGERRPRRAKLEVAGDEAIPRAHGKRDHREPVKGRGPRLRRDRCGGWCDGMSKTSSRRQRRTGGCPRADRCPTWIGSNVPPSTRFDVERSLVQPAARPLFPRVPVPRRSPLRSNPCSRPISVPRRIRLQPDDPERRVDLAPAPDDSRPASSGPPRSTIRGQTASSSAVHALARDGGDRQQREAPGRWRVRAAAPAARARRATSILFAATICGRSSRSAWKRSSSRRITSRSSAGSRPDANDTSTT